MGIISMYRNYVRSLSLILLSEGYWQKGSYYYFLKDHLGSNRVVLQNDGYIAETSNYYPSGMRFGESVASGGNVQPYRHIGKEMQSMHGLNWYDNGARMRQVDIPVWTTVDPLAEKYYSISPYAYCRNNFTNSIDPDGLTDYNVSSDGTIYIKPDAERKLGDITVRYYSELPKSKPGEADTFFAVDNKGNATGSLYTVKDGVSMSSFGGSGVYNGISEQFRIDNVKLSNDQDGKGLFEFFADNTRTGGKHHQGIEWSRFRLGDGSNLITTSHQEGHDWGASYALNSLFKAGIDIREFIHNHPNQNPAIPSGYVPNPVFSGDKRFVYELNQRYPSAAASVYSSMGKNYTYYSYEQILLRVKSINRH